MGKDAYRRRLDAQLALGAQAFESRQARARLTVIEKDAENPGIVYGSEDGVGRFPIIAMSRALEPGEIVLAERAADRVAGAVYRYIDHIQSDLPAPGLLRKEPGPAPSFASGTWHTERIESVDRITIGRITVYYTIDPEFIPSKVYVNHKPSAVAEWASQAVPFDPAGGIQAAEIAMPYNSGVSVDLYLSAEYQYAYSPAVSNDQRTIVIPADVVTPGSATGLAVDVTVAGIMKLTASGAIDRSRFLGWRYEIRTSPGGVLVATPVIDGFFEFHGAGTFEVAVAPISMAGVLGTRFPSPAGWDGPYTVTVAALPPDNTAPAAWSAPTVTPFTRVRSDGSEAAFLRVAFPAHSFESDYAKTGVRLWNGTTFDDRLIQYRGSAPSTQEYLVDFGTWEVWLYGVDNSDNVSALSPSASATITPTGIPSGATNPTIRQIGLANEVQFTMPSGAETVQIERSDDAGGTVNVVTVWEGKGIRYLDLHTELVTFPKTYYYRIRGRNFTGDGAWSSRIGGTLTALDGVTIAANTINGDRVIANTLDANTVKTNTILAALIKTAASGNRWEIEGATGGGNAMQIRAYEVISAVDRLRVKLDKSGLIVYGDSGSQTDITMNRNSSGRGQLIAQGVTIAHDGTRPYIAIATAASGGFLGQLRFGATWGTDVIQQGTYTVYDTHVWTRDQNTSDEPVFAITGNYVTEKLALWGNGIGSNIMAGTDGITFRANSSRWVSNGGVAADHIAGGADNGLGYFGAPFYFRQGSALGTTGGNTQRVGSFHYPSGTDNMLLDLLAYRGQNNTNKGDARFSFLASAVGVANGGALQLGFRGSSAFWSLGQGNTSELFLDESNNRIATTRNTHIGGALSKTSGSWVIPDPTPGYEDYDLRHTFAEAPNAGENFYSYRIVWGPRGGGFAVEDPEGNPVEGATIERLGADQLGPERWRIVFPLPDYFPYVNSRPRVMISNNGDAWGQFKARKISDQNAIEVLSTEAGEYTVDVRGMRIDPDAVAWWGPRGVRKRKAQRWTRDHIPALRAATLAARALRDDPNREVAKVFPPGVFVPGHSTIRVA